MAGRKAAKQAAPKLEEDDDTEGWEDAVVETETEQEADLRMRDWRDVERYREMRELRRLVDDDYGLEEIFQAPARSRGEPGNSSRVAKNAKSPKLVPPPKAAKPASKALTKKGPSKAAPSLKAKAKRR